MSNLGVNERFGKQTVQNEIYNLRYLAHCNSEEDFEGVFPEDAPAIVVAAGPSLEKNVDLLQEAKGKALIVAVDTIFKYLMDRGIRPDVVVTADPHKGVHLFNFPGASTVPVAFDSPVNYRILDIMKDGKPIFISSECPYYNKLYETIGRQMYTLTAGGSVATLAFALVVAWGFRRIVLVGQDLALSPDKVHAGNVGTDRGRLQGELIPVEGYYGDTVYTSPDYHHYLEWYNIVVANNLDIEVINATEGGARIQGAVNMSLREVIDTYCNLSFDFEKTILEFPVNFDEKAFASIRKEWSQSIENLTQLGFKLVKGIGLVKTEITKIRKGKYSQKEVATVQKQINQILEECDSYSEIYFVDFLVSQKESDLLGDIYFEEKDSADECCRILDKLRHYMEMLENAIDEVKAHFTYILEQTQEEVR
jgi:hypothetical protein